MKRLCKHKIPVILGGVLLILAMLLTGLLVVRSDWRYGLADLFRSRSPQQPSILAVAEADSRPLSLTAALQGQVEGVTPDHSLLLVNETHRLQDFQPTLVEFRQTGLLVDAAIVTPLEELLQANREATGENLLLLSTYRSAQEQAQVQQEEGALAASPGASEHQTGLALDVYVPQKAQRRFIDSPSGVWVDRQGWAYGFIIRYPFLRSGETGKSYEPWHLRYVGKPHAELIYRNRYTLESYLDALVVGEYYAFGGYGFSLQTPNAQGELCLPADWTQVSLSPDNRGRYMLTGRLENR